MGIKERTTAVLLLLFLLGGLRQEEVEWNDRVAGLLSLPTNNKTRSTLRSLIRLGFVAEHQQRYRITKEGIDELALSFPYVRYFFSSWDQKWRIVSYEIPETQRKLRDTFRRRMAGWGLGPWHRSFWISPHPIIPALESLLKEHAARPYVQAFESTHVVGDRSVLVEKVWNTGKLEAQYRALFKSWHTILSQDIAQEQKLRQVLGAFVDVLRVDPGLPRELLGEQWVGKEAMNIFEDIRSILLQKA